MPLQIGADSRLKTVRGSADIPAVVGVRTRSRSRNDRCRANVLPTPSDQRMRRTIMNRLLRKFRALVAVALTCAISSLPSCGTMGGGMGHFVDPSPGAPPFTAT